MKKSSVKELRSKSAEELSHLLKEKKNELAKEIVLLGARKLKDTAGLGEKKKDIARILTIMKEKELTKK